ncbi:hypothetical protein ACFVJK_43365 [Streptomyces sp. NPDC127172]|uniref:hypothetical protein n=1 Tax=Streptomyces sp. NPDC127172 TaxID=3345382 RepID=UPI0036383AA5
MAMYRRYLERISRAAQKVSTRPTASSYTWGGRRSPLAFIVFHLFFLMRLLSPLQWLKYSVRRRNSAKPPTTNQRPDFPAAYTEWYFILILVAAGTAYVVRHAAGPHTPLLLAWLFLGVGWLLLIECVVWVMYYLMLRAFVERYYTIFHPAEYVVTFPLLLTIQVLLVSDVTGRGITDLLQAFIGNPEAGDAFGTTLAVFGLAYLGVAITVVLSSHPGIDTRTAQTVSVIGAGDVTLNRILPALKILGYERSGITISSIEDSETANARTAIGDGAQFHVASPDKVLATALREHAPTIIASPTFSHFTQLVALATAGIPFAVEKPIASGRPERTVLRAEGTQLMARGFALSYYSLEKALPLTYFLQPLPVYSRFLATSEPGLLGGAALHALREELGPAQSVHIDVLEGASRSPASYGRLWTEVPGTLHPFIETTIHPLLLLRHIAGAGPINWTGCALGRHAPRAAQVRAEYGQEIAPTWLEATAQHGTIDVRMRVAKHVPASLAQRHAVITYANGLVTANFDSRRVDFEVNGQNRGWIAIDTSRDAGRYQQNYAVLISLFTEFAINGWGAVRFDDFERQLDALDHWDDLCELVDQHQPSVTEYTTESLATNLPRLVQLGTTAVTPPQRRSRTTPATPPTP